jgi:hypothetical protein
MSRSVPQREEWHMNLDSKRAPRKAMRVATVFTGVAACAAAFVPTANAHALGRPARHPALKVKPETTGIRSVANCGSKDATWFRAYWTIPYDSSPQSVCVGYAGKMRIAGHDYWGYCGGNNRGSITHSIDDTIGHTKGFTPSNSIYYFRSKFGYPGSVDLISSVAITKWSGSEQCPYFLHP